MKRFSRTPAFSLIEVLVALAIFAMAAIVLGATYVNVLNSYAAIDRDRDADQDVQFAISQLRAIPDLLTAEAGDQFDSTNNRHVTWTCTIEPTTIADLFTVTFNCELDDPGVDPKKSTLTFTLFRPTWSDAVQRSQLLQDAKDRIAAIQQAKQQ
jgi:general secretion pathway protein I